MQRRGRDLIEQGVQLRDLSPSGLVERLREAMLGGDAGLGVITREPLTTRRSREPFDTDADLVAIPKRTVLLFEKQEVAGAVDTAREAGAVEVHQREKCRGLGHIADWMFGEKC